MIARLKCFFWGHKRGKRLTMVTTTSTMPMNHFRCPRCGSQWTRKAKA
jgi:transcription elongation factor Elf1